jgi:UDP-N-acetylmuramyl pentapeptide phosphotransferase/UDP-N-acetylglucosamine-1-phosphate transferase|tara:strand:- start:978 stop:2009 length:1032 start_codon:yes stop_codon:yes gene_type:complete
MQFYFFISVFFIFYLLAINFFLKKFNISLDKEAVDEKHKSLLRKDDSTPLSGTFYFLPIILFFFYNQDLKIVICCSLLFLLGLLADLKIVTSYKLRLIFQFLLISSIFLISKDVMIDTRIIFINNLMNYDLTRILLCTFFFMVLINGFNLIDGTNCLCSLNLLIISIFLYLLIKKSSIGYMNEEINILMLSLSIFLLFNFFGKNFLGDGAAYGLGFIFGYFLLKISLINNNISPYFIANLLLYPAFEILFSILRRNFSKDNNYLPDNDHLHQLIFKFFKKKKIIKKNFLLSSLTGISINSILFLNYYIGFNYHNNTMIQITLIISLIFLYLISYYFLNKKLVK